MEFLITNRTTMRPIQKNDGALIYSLDSLAEVKKFLGEFPLNSLNEAENYVQYCVDSLEKHQLGWYLVFEKESSAFIGLCGIHHYFNEFNQRTNFVALRYRFLPEHWGRGFATETAEKVLFSYNGIMANDEVICMVHPLNIASKNVLMKLGFSFENTFFSVGDTWEWHSLKIVRKIGN